MESDWTYTNFTTTVLDQVISTYFWKFEHCIGTNYSKVFLNIFLAIINSPSNMWNITGTLYICMFVGARGMEMVKVCFNKLLILKFTKPNQHKLLHSCLFWLLDIEWMIKAFNFLYNSAGNFEKMSLWIFQIILITIVIKQKSYYHLRKNVHALLTRCTYIEVFLYTCSKYT